jgi:molybdopterin converting factor small subunit
LFPTKGEVMNIRVMIPSPLRAFTEKKDAVYIEGNTVGELLGKLTTQHAQLRKHLYTENGALRTFVNVYVNNDDIRYLNNEDTPVKESDVVSIIPSIAGGRN